MNLSIDTESFLRTAREVVEEVKGEDIRALDFQEIENSFCRIFLICSGRSSTHVRAISDTLERQLRKKLHQKPNHVEMAEGLQWVLLDYIEVVVHIFLPDARAYYDIEGFWHEAQEIDLERFSSVTEQ